MEEEVERVRLRGRGARAASAVAAEEGWVAVSAVGVAGVCEEEGEAESS